MQTLFSKKSAATFLSVFAFLAAALFSIAAPTTSFIVMFSAPVAHAADNNVYAIPLPCEGVKIVNGVPQQDCDFNDLVQLVSNVLTFLLLLSITIATFAIAWCGWKILWAGSSSSEIGEAKKMLVKILWGFFFALTSWLIVKLVVEGILLPGSYTSFF